VANDLHGWPNRAHSAMVLPRRRVTARRWR
jgi:hypothetical protein